MITAQEIKSLGANDLVDVLRTVPGFDFAHDVDFAMGLSVRGNWAFEGKVLVLVDGHEYNELSYQTVSFGNRFPVDQIERIEIIRGPGSAIHGGTAEYGVISITTKGASGREGIMAHGTYGQLKDKYGRRNLGLQFGKNVNKNTFVDVSLHHFEGIRSDQLYQDMYMEYDKVDLSNTSNTQSSGINFGIKSGDFKLRSLYEHYGHDEPIHETHYNQYSISAEYKFQPTKKLVVTPKLSMTNQLPWNAQSRETGETIYDLSVSRYKFNVTGSYDFSRKINLVAGSEYFIDRARARQEEDYFGEGKNKIGYENTSFFAQGLIKHPFANLTVGFRFDDHSAFGSAFVPRLGLTKRFNNFHFKTLYSKAYRAPAIENINANSDIRPEKSDVFEMELGYQFTPNMLLAVNAYRIKTKDIITYFYIDLDEENFDEGYLNNPKYGSKGIELIYKIKKQRWFANLNYSFYKTLSDADASTYQLHDNKDLYVGFPAHKLAVYGGVNLTDDLSINTSFIQYSERFGYETIDEEEEVPILSRRSAYALVNLFADYDNILTNGLSVGLGVNDLLNASEPVLQAYNGDYSPISGKSREFFIKLVYNFDFKK